MCIRDSALSEELKRVEKRRDLIRSRRKKDGVITVAIVGYTNAGLSSSCSIPTTTSIPAFLNFSIPLPATKGLGSVSPRSPPVKYKKKLCLTYRYFFYRGNARDFQAVFRPCQAGRNRRPKYLCRCLLYTSRCIRDRHRWKRYGNGNRGNRDRRRRLL